MKVNVVSDPVPHILVEDYFNEEELRKIWLELDFHQSNTNTLKPHWATPSPNQALSMHKSGHIWIDEIFKDRNFSHIDRVWIKLLKDKTVLGNPQNWYFKDFQYREHHVMINYYETKDFYDVHRDECCMSIISWFYKEPKKFKGGDFHFNDYNLSFECKNNSFIAFPSQIRHSVDVVSMEEEDQGKGLGRYSIGVMIRQ